MELVAAIDLLGGRANRLVQGDFDRPLHDGADPVELARRWVAAGVRRLHVVDLDGARRGASTHLKVISRIALAAHAHAPDARVEASGGLRTLRDVEGAISIGADEVVLGSAALEDAEFLAACAVRWPGRVGAALDVRDGQLSVEGWSREVAGDALEVAGRLLDAGASRLVVTDVLRDGTGSGPNVDLMRRLRGRYPTAVLVAAGGVGTARDLRALAGLGIDAAIVGRALFDGSLPVAEALEACAARGPTATAVRGQA
jgi:phosphoribosylformimino-5-aminoimidazole carboxamide ribotide isomerase